MPAPQATVMAMQIKTLIMAEQAEVPMDYEGDTKDKVNKDTDSFKSKVAKPTNLLKAPGKDKIAIDSTDDISKSMDEFIDEMCKAICTSWSNWQNAAMFTTGVISAVTCMISPGSLTSPPYMSASTIIANVNSAGKPANFMLFVKAIATAIENAWKAWESGLMGTIMFPPSFASFPGPMHPPTPNIPMPLVALSSAGDALMKKNALSGLMVANLSGVPINQLNQMFFEKFAEGFCLIFDIWKASTLISNVMGSGPIPTFAPPFVPAGPVMAGYLMPLPGVLI